MGNISKVAVSSVSLNKRKDAAIRRQPRVQRNKVSHGSGAEVVWKPSIVYGISRGRFFFVSQLFSLLLLSVMRPSRMPCLQLGLPLKLMRTTCSPCIRKPHSLSLTLARAQSLCSSRLSGFHPRCRQSITFPSISIGCRVLLSSVRH